MDIARLQASFVSDDLLHFNHAGVSPIPKVAQAAIAEAAEEMYRGGLGALTRTFETVESCRTRLSTHLELDAAGLFLTQTCAKAISEIAFGLAVRPGQNIVLCDLEYPSNQYPWFEMARRNGMEIRLIPSTEPGRFPTDMYLSAIDEHTAVTTFSWVQYEAGAVAPVEQITQKAHAVGAQVIVDGIQGLGVMPHRFMEWGVDAVVGGSQKWLTGPIGLGFGWLSPSLRNRLPPLTYGAMSYGTPDDAAVYGKALKPSPYRFEPGAPPMLAAIGLEASIEMWQAYPIDAIYAAATQHADALKAFFKDAGLTVFESSDVEQPSPIITALAQNKEQHMRIERALADRVFYSQRAGGFRFAPHASTRGADVEQLIAWIAAAL